MTGRGGRGVQSRPSLGRILWRMANMPLTINGLSRHQRGSLVGLGAIRYRKRENKRGKITRGSRAPDRATYGGRNGACSGPIDTRLPRIKANRSCLNLESCAMKGLGTKLEPKRKRRPTRKSPQNKTRPSLESRASTAVASIGAS